MPLFPKVSVSFLLVYHEENLETPYIFSKRSPFLVLPFVPDNIVEFSQDEQHERKNVDDDKSCISSVVQWRVICSIDVC